MRHGESEGNLIGKVSCKSDDPDHLTEKGKKEVLNSTKNLKNKKIDIVISSSFFRTKETAEIVLLGLGKQKSNLIVDERIGELDIGDF